MRAMVVTNPRPAEREPLDPLVGTTTVNRHMPFSMIRILSPGLNPVPD